MRSSLSILLIIFSVIVSFAQEEEAFDQLSFVSFAKNNNSALSPLNAAHPYARLFTEELMDDTQDKEFTIGLNFNTHAGIIGGLALRYGIEGKNDWSYFGTLEIVNIKDHKEERFSSAVDGSSFILGKTNYLFSIRPQYVVERLLFKKYPEEGVQLSAVLGGGPSIGVVKPYYIKYPEDNDFRTTRAVPFDPDVHQFQRIRGSGGFFSGFNQARFELGVNMKLGLNFEFAQSKNIVSGIETGWSLEYYPNTIDIVPKHNDENNSIYSAVYLILYYGSRL